jgi:hypothetical protein
MQFPVDITFKLLGWSARVQITDGAGNVIGRVPPLKKGLLDVPVYADEVMGSPIYTIKAEHMFTHWFEDAAGRRIGEYGITAAGGMGGGKCIFVGAEPRFYFARESEWADFLDRMIPSLPILNALTGPLIRLSTNVMRNDGNSAVLKVEKRRHMIDVSYRLHALEEVTDSERECLILAALVHSYMDLSFKQI